MLNRNVLALWLCLGMQGSPALHSAAAAAAAEEPRPSDELAGLWTAQRRFGPEARGPLLLEQNPSGWVADFLGRHVRVREANSVLSFELADGAGSFRARLSKSGGINSGQWFQPEGLATAAYATRIQFAAAGPHRWRGEILPIEDAFTLFLMLNAQADGTLHAFIGNPERNIGVFYDADRLERHGDQLQLIGRRRGGNADGVLMSGEYDAANGVLRLYFPDRGGSFDFRRDGDNSAFYPRGRHPPPYAYRPPPALGDGWPVASLEQVGLDRRGIESFVQRILDTPMDSVQAPQVHGILIARHGRLALEEYFHGYHRDLLHDTRSAGKSLTATLIGAAMFAGADIRLTSRVYQVMNHGVIPADLEPGKLAMTLENLLTMNSGFFCDDGNPDAPGNEDGMLDQRAEPDFYRYTLRVPLDRIPGERAVYCSADPNLALGMLTVVTGEHPMDLFDRLIGGPLQIRRHAWFLSPSQQPYGGGGIRMTPRDFMKLGQLMLNGGTWEGRRILSRDFVRRASSPLYRLNRIQYGYLWWSIDYPYKNRSVHAFFAGGNGGQGVIVVPELDLVIATYAGNYASRVGLEIQQAYTPRYILPAVREPGDQFDAPVVPRDFTVLYGREPPAK
jgi:CubicO group peptidase (beta-lactamase class C family)